MKDGREVQRRRPDWWALEPAVTERRDIVDELSDATGYFHDDDAAKLRHIASASGMKPVGIVRAAVEQEIEDREWRCVYFDDSDERGYISSNAYEYYRIHRAFELEYNAAIEALPKEENSRLREVQVFEHAADRLEAEARKHRAKREQAERFLTENGYDIPEVEDPRPNSDEPELVTDGGVDTANSGYNASVWNGPERDEKAPKRCPHCDRPLAHPEELRENENIAAYGLFTAYREHRQAHFSWGDDPREHGDRYGDPYLGNYYDTSRDATYEPDEDQPAGDPDEVVGHVFDVDIRHEATVRARVVAPDKQRAKEKAEDLRITDGEDLDGNVPEAHLTTKLHTYTTEAEEVHRADTDLAERMEGWPW